MVPVLNSITMYLLEPCLGKEWTQVLAIHTCECAFTHSPPGLRETHPRLLGSGSSFLPISCSSITHSLCVLSGKGLGETYLLALPNFCFHS